MAIDGIERCIQLRYQNSNDSCLEDASLAMLFKNEFGTQEPIGYLCLIISLRKVVFLRSCLHLRRVNSDRNYGEESILKNQSRRRYF